MQLNFLDYEQPIAELEAKIDELRYMSNDSDLNITEEIQKLKEKSESLTRSIFSGLTPWQVTQMARHPQRPYTFDYIKYLITDFEELHGDRAYADDQALITGMGRF
ncbi:MAG TPA: acetyl-CoA carboxylase carboxyl transferase subunit alpha, partial [Methylophaga sp.]|nr:acetyl-CoA carboxylase carboxyl transferase subunit alpha [Methylophaga sp.]